MKYDYLYDLFEAIASTSSRKEKEALLAEHKQDSMLQRVIVMALDPMKVYGIKKIPKYEKSNRPIMELGEALRNVIMLEQRRITGQRAIDLLQYTLSSLDWRDADVVERIITKDLRCGVSTKTVNKVWPGLVFEYGVALCQPLNEQNLKNIRFPAIAQVKYDGMRANLHVDFQNRKVMAFSRNGKELDFGEFLKPLSFAYNHGKIIVDGEFLVRDGHGKDASILPRKKGNGILNKVMKGTASDDEQARVFFVAWDYLMANEFEAGQSVVPYNMRFKALKQYVSDTQSKIGRGLIELTESVEVDSFYDARAFYDSCISAGQEGIILKNRDFFWKIGRLNDQLKMKVENEADLLIVGVEEGRGKYEGKLGNFILESADGGIRVSVGTGFSDEQRDLFFTEKMVGKVVTVKYNEVIEKDGSDVKSLFLPVFIEVRDDKDVADSTEKVMQNG